MGTLSLQSNKNGVKRYDAGTLSLVNGTVYTKQVFLTADHSIDKNIPNATELEMMNGINTVSALCDEYHITTLIIGIELEGHILAQLTENFGEKKVGVEIMSPQPACWTFNAVLSEGRQVALLIFP